MLGISFPSLRIYYLQILILILILRLIGVSRSRCCWNKTSLVSRQILIMPIRPPAKRSSHERNASLSPPPSKRKLESTTTSKPTPFLDLIVHLLSFTSRESRGQLLYPRIPKAPRPAPMENSQQQSACWQVHPTSYPSG